MASSSSNVSGDPLYPYLLDQKSMSTSDSRQVIDAVNDQKETIFVNEKEGPIENVSVLPVPGYDFMLVQGFPRQITDVMVSNANQSGFILEGCLLILFALLLIYLFKKMRDRRKHLEVENRIFVDVLEGVKILFNSRYLVVDLDQDTYTYMAGSGPINTRIPMEGIYSQFIQYHTADIIGDEEKKAFDHFAQPETLSKFFGGQMK